LNILNNKNINKGTNLSINKDINDKKNNNFDKISINIYKCAYYYYMLQNLFETEFNNLNSNYSKINLYLIDKNWMINFKRICNYDLIKKKLNDNFTNCDKLVEGMVNNYPSPILECEPNSPSKYKIKENDWYYENYEFIDEYSLDQLSEIFSNNNINLKKLRVILKEKMILVNYDHNKLEVINNYDDKDNKKERFLFSVKEDNKFSKIVNIFIREGYNNAFNELKISNKNVVEQTLTFENDSEFGKMWNKSMLNKGRMNQCNPDSNENK
jgi:hypothetical protein